jgi:ABC-2 type transport system ATP-binding protein
MYPLAFTNVTKAYHGHVVVDDLTFTARPGRVTGFLGPNGAGKSTTMKILLDLASAGQGTATIGPLRYRELADPVRTVGVVIEPNAFHPGRTGYNHLRVLADAAGIGASRVEEVLTQVGLADAADRRVGAYSLGMRQRLSLAAALLGDPPVLVLDEPGNGLDPQGIHDLRTMLRERAAQGHTVFVSSHLLSEVEQLADDLVVVDKGRLVAAGALEDLRQGAVSVRSPRSADLGAALVAAGASLERTAPDTVHVEGLDAAAVGELAFDVGIPVHELVPAGGSLEELFLRWTSQSDRSHIVGDFTAASQKEVVRS